MTTHSQLIMLATHTHTRPFNGPFPGPPRWAGTRKVKPIWNLDFTEARDSEWQWHQLNHMQVCTSFQTDNHASTPPLSFLQAGCPSCHPTNSVKALKDKRTNDDNTQPTYYASCFHSIKWNSNISLVSLCLSVRWWQKIPLTWNPHTQTQCHSSCGFVVRVLQWENPGTVAKCIML